MYDELLRETNEHDKKIEGLSTRIQNLEITSSSRSESDLRSIQKNLNDLEQYSRLENLEIHGLKQELEGESLLRELNTLARTPNLPEFTTREVEGLHRHPSKTDKAPSVLVRFGSRATRDEWLGKRAALRAMRSDIYFHENLTLHTRKLFWVTKSRAGEKGYQFAWTRQGKVFVRKRLGEPVIGIVCEEDLCKIV